MPKPRLTPEMLDAMAKAPKPLSLEPEPKPKKPRRKGQTPEGAVLSACLDYLALRGVLAWRNNTGAVRVEDRFLRFGRVGSSDILGVLNGGRLLAIECKAPGKKPTEEQQRFLDDVSMAGGLALCVDDVAKLVAALEDC